MAQAGTLHEAFIEELRDTYDAEKQLIKALPKMAKAAASTELRTAFETHLEETRGHVERLEQVFESLGEKAKSKPCSGMKGLVEEGQEIIGEDFDDDVKDTGLIGAGRKVEHYEIIAYESIIALAKAVKANDAVEIRVPEHLFRWSNWEILSSSMDYTKTDSNTIEFRPQVPAGGETVITYTVRYTWPE